MNKEDPPALNEGQVCGLNYRRLFDQDSLPAPSQQKQEQSQQFFTPTRKIEDNEWPALIDDLHFEGMELALERQLQRYSQIDLNGTIQLGTDTFKLFWAKKSLLRFQKFLHQYRTCHDKPFSRSSECDEEFMESVKRDFHMYMPALEPGDIRYGESQPVLFTAYYTPTLSASLEKTEKFKYAIYRKPPLEKKNSYTRANIDFHGALEGENLELYYTDDLFNLYLMHVQGGGRVVLKHKRKSVARYLSFDGTNGKSWNFISKYMKENNMISDGSIWSQRDYLERNSHLQEEIYGSCPSYVYFKKTSHAPEGSDRVPLTDNRSIATDIAHYKFKGLLAFVMAERPLENQKSGPNSCLNTQFKPYSRFYIDQDTGGAIKGKGRVDLYFGEGEYAELAAYNLVKRGQLYFLMLKP